jgi:uncharacterized membrane protein YkvA (DUF1232 family)
MIYRLFNFFIFYYFRSLLKTRRMAKQVGLLRAVLFYYFRSLLKTRRIAKQIGLLRAVLFDYFSKTAVNKSTCLAILLVLRRLLK